MAGPMSDTPTSAATPTRTAPDAGAPLVLAIDTSHDVRVGVARGGEVLARAALADTRQHVEQLMPLVRQALAEAGLTMADLTAVAVGLGPGPFTGLRVGIATAGTLAAVGGLDLHGVCSLDVVAAQHLQQRRPNSEFLTVGDARRSELYWARYDADGNRIDGPHVGAPAELPALPVVGPGTAVLTAVDAGRAQAASGPDSVDAGLMAARFTDIPAAGQGLEPLYLRRPDATVSTRRKSALAVPRVRRRRQHDRAADDQQPSSPESR